MSKEKESIGISSGKTLAAIIEFIRIWPKGSVVFITRNGKIISEEAEAEEINDYDTIRK